MSPDTGAGPERALMGLRALGFGVGSCDPQAPDGPLLGAELAAASSMRPGRRAEFTAGRVAARKAMAQIGLTPTAIPMGDDRAPIWPSGVCGSISHCETGCIAAVRRKGPSFGLDLEMNQTLPPEIIESVCDSDELCWLESQPLGDQGQLARLIFSAKEASYKAQYPLSRQIFGFETLNIQVSRDTQQFVARFTRDLSSFTQSTEIYGIFRKSSQFILTFCSFDRRILRALRKN